MHYLRWWTQQLHILPSGISDPEWNLLSQLWRERVQFPRSLRCLLFFLLWMLSDPNKLPNLRSRFRQIRIHLPEGMSIRPILRYQSKGLRELPNQLRCLLCFQLLHKLRQCCHYSSWWSLLELSISLRNLRRNWSMHDLPQWFLLLPETMSDHLPSWSLPSQRSLHLLFGYHFEWSLRCQLPKWIHCHQWSLCGLQLQLR